MLVWKTLFCKKCNHANKKITKGGRPDFGKIKLRKDELSELYPDTKRLKIF